MQNEILYFKDRKGNLYTKQTKSEIKESINPIIPETFIYILKDMDYPYFEDEWGIILAHTALHGDLKNVIGKYISKMRLHDFKNFSFEDSIYNKNLTEFRLNSYGINIKDGHYKYSINHLIGIRGTHYIDHEHFHNCCSKEKIAKILTDKLCYCYCDNCEFGNWDKYQDTKCDDCHRKYQNWRLSENTAKAIAKQIIKEIKYAE